MPPSETNSDSTLIIDNPNHWAPLLLKEALAIKNKTPRSKSRD